jgi:hypothetical protein
MTQKYSRILQAARYYAAIDNYIKYITDASKRGQKVGAGDPRPVSQLLYVEPFTLKLGTGTVAHVSGAKPTWTAHQAVFALHTKDTLPASIESIKINGFRAARAVITTGRLPKGAVAHSKVTGMAYLNYKGKSTSIPFGRKSTTETEAEAFAELKGALLPSVPGALITLQPEKIANSI